MKFTFNHSNSDKLSEAIGITKEELQELAEKVHNSNLSELYLQPVEVQCFVLGKMMYGQHMADILIAKLFGTGIHEESSCSMWIELFYNNEQVRDFMVEAVKLLAPIEKRQKATVN